MNPRAGFRVFVKEIQRRSTIVSESMIFVHYTIKIDSERRSSDFVMELFDEC
jgi:hypothetical protein